MCCYFFGFGLFDWFGELGWVELVGLGWIWIFVILRLRPMGGWWMMMMMMLSPAAVGVPDASFLLFGFGNEVNMYEVTDWTLQRVL